MDGTHSREDILSALNKTEVAAVATSGRDHLRQRMMHFTIDDEMTVYQKVCDIVDEWIEIYNTEGNPLPSPTNKNYSGKFVLRTGSELHQALAVRALNEGESLNRFVVKTLKRIV